MTLNLLLFVLGILIGLCIGNEKIRTSVLTWLRLHITKKTKGKRRKAAVRKVKLDD